MALSTTKTGIYNIITGTKQEVTDYLSANDGSIKILGFTTDLVVGTTSVLLYHI